MQHCSISVTLWLTYTDDGLDVLRSLCVHGNLLQQFVFISFYGNWQSLHSFRKEQVSLRGNDMACIKCTKMSFAPCRGCWNNQQSSCAIRQYGIRLFVLFPPKKWIKNISCSVTWQRLSLVFSNFLQYAIVQWFCRCCCSRCWLNITSTKDGLPNCRQQRKLP